MCRHARKREIDVALVAAEPLCEQRTEEIMARGGVVGGGDKINNWFQYDIFCVLCLF